MPGFSLQPRLLQGLLFLQRLGSARAQGPSKGPEERRESLDLPVPQAAWAEVTPGQSTARSSGC